MKIVFGIGRIKPFYRLRAKFFRPPDCVVEEKKIVDYLLNPEHANGAAKAKFFLAGGFDRRKPIVMRRALEKHFRDHRTLAELTRDRFGCEVLTIRAPMAVPDGRNPIVKSVWRRDEPSQPMRLVTAHPD